MKKIFCDYCGKPAERITGKDLYPHRPDLYAKKFWRCTPCEAYVGCHKLSDTPLGRLANASLRRAKSRAHAAFDPLWQAGKMSRADAYSWLSSRLKLPRSQTHIGMFDEEMCLKVIEVCNERGF